MDFVQNYSGKPLSEGKIRNVKPIWIYWRKRYWVAVASAGQYAPDR